MLSFIIIITGDDIMCPFCSANSYTQAGAHSPSASFY